MYKNGIYLALIETAGLIGFILMSRYQDGERARFFPLLVALTTIGYVAYLSASAMSYKAIAYVALVASATFVFLVQVLGFVVFPGLAKDVDLLSSENATRVGLVLTICFIGHGLLLTLARVARGPQ